MKKIPVIIDTDPGVDDALALIAAFASDNIDIKLLTSVGGNVALFQTTKNLLHLSELYDPFVPVAKGFFSTSKYKIGDASNVHGELGLGLYKYGEINKKIIEKNAVQAMYDVLKNSDEKITLISLGPQTNIASLLTQYKDASRYIEKIVIMGGSNLGRGNVTDYAEFNIRFDVEAAMTVLNSDTEKIYVPMEMGHTAFFDYGEMEEIKGLNATGLAVFEMSAEYRDQHVSQGVATHDSCAVAFVADSSLFKTKKAKMIIDMSDLVHIGCTVCDYEATNPNIEICTEVDILRFKNYIRNCIVKAEKLKNK